MELSLTLYCIRLQGQPPQCRLQLHQDTAFNCFFCTGKYSRNSANEYTFAPTKNGSPLSPLNSVSVGVKGKCGTSVHFGSSIIALIYIPGPRVLSQDLHGAWCAQFYLSLYWATRQSPQSV